MPHYTVENVILYLFDMSDYAPLMYQIILFFMLYLFQMSDYAPLMYDMILFFMLYLFDMSDYAPLLYDMILLKCHIVPLQPVSVYSFEA